MKANENIKPDQAVLYPIILPVPECVRQWPSRDRVIFLSRHAREALAISAERGGIELGDLAKDADGTPLPSNGSYWSLTHKSTYVAAVASPDPVGIDLEEIRSLHEGLYQRVAGKDEWDLASTDKGEETLFFRFWTAKEAVMKAAGTGIKDLSRIKIRRINDEKSIDLTFHNKSWKVTQYFFDNHIAALAAAEINARWTHPPFIDHPPSSNPHIS